MKTALAILLLPAGALAAAAQTAERYERKSIYHSPQSPGYTSWTGVARPADGSIVVGFTQATGPLDSAARERAPLELTDRLGVTALIQKEPNYDFWGLTLSAVYLRSADGGATWRPLRSDGYRAVYPHGYAAQGLFALPDGTLIRRVNGWDLMHDPTIPPTAFLQRLAPGAAAWSAPQTLLDPATRTCQLSRLRRLRDGRLLGTGQRWDCPAGTAHAAMSKAPASHLIVVSGDEGKTWTSVSVVVPAGAYLSVDEWDCAELPGGDLLAVFRTRRSAADRTAVRRQGILRKQGASWTLAEVKDAPFPHSGHPELLVTREGPVLHIATTGVHWTSDAGHTWTPLAFPQLSGGYRSPYYPVSFQASDGRIHVVGHVGADDWYGRRDQSVLLDRFSLAGFEAPAPPPDDCRGHWSLDDGGGNLALDGSGFGHDGILANGPAWRSAGAVGGALGFDGVDDRVDAGDSAGLGPGAALTVAAWVKIASKSAQRKVAGRWADLPSPDYACLLTIRGEGYDRPAFAVRADATALVEAAAALEVGRWTHLAGTYDGATLRIYMDGRLEATRALAGAIRTSSAPFRIGGGGSGDVPESPFHGEIDEVRLYGRALAEAEIRSLATSTAAGAEADPRCGALGVEALLLLAALRPARASYRR
jgi:hypothetical protein